MDDVIKIVKPIFGINCVRAGRSTGTIFLLDFGAYYPPVKKNRHGTYDWSLLVGDCWWEITKDNELIVGNGASEKDIESGIKELTGKQITNIEISDDFKETKFYFEKGLLLTCKNKSHNKYEDWSLKTPEGKFLEVGPKHNWRFVSGDDTTNW